MTSQDISIENTGDDRGIEAEAENVARTANYMEMLLVYLIYLMTKQEEQLRRL